MKNEFKLSFRGDSVTVRLKPYTPDGLRRLQAEASKVSIEPQPGDTAQKLELFARIVPEYVKSIEGVVAADNSPVTMDEIMDHDHFAGLVYGIGTALLRAAISFNKSGRPR